MRGAGLKKKLRDGGGKEEGAFLLNHGDALRAGAGAQRMDDKSVEKNAAREGLENSGNQLKQGGLAAGVGPENGDDFAGAGLKAGGFESEERSLRRICGVGVADLLGGYAHLGA